MLSKHKQSYYNHKPPHLRFHHATRNREKKPILQTIQKIINKKQMFQNSINCNSNWRSNSQFYQIFLVSTKMPSVHIPLCVPSPTSHVFEWEMGDPHSLVYSQSSLHHVGFSSYAQSFTPSSSNRSFIF